MQNDPVCAKCGKDWPPLTKYHRTGILCDVRSLSWRLGEHLHLRCACCGYDWCEAILPIPSALPPTQAPVVPKKSCCDAEHAQNGDFQR